MPKIELIFTHTHAGAVYQAGDVLDVDSYTAKWLIERGVADLVNAAMSSEHAPKKPKKASAKPSTSDKE